MRAAAGVLVLRSLGISSELRNVNQRGFASRTATQLRQYSQRAEDSSASNWGTGEPPIDEKQTQRGVSGHQATSGGAPEVGRRNDESTSVSNFDTGEHTGGQDSSGPKKSRTGGDMSDEGQVHTPNLGKMRSTRDMIKGKGKETEDRLAAEKRNG